MDMSFEINGFLWNHHRVNYPTERSQVCYPKKILSSLGGNELALFRGLTKNSLQY